MTSPPATGAQLEERTVRGWQVLRLSNEGIQVDIVPALGGSVVSLVRRADAAELLWSTPWGLRHRGAWAPAGNAEAMMMDTFPGGWHTLFPNAGDSAILHGAEWGVDGEARLTWLDWTAAESLVSMTGRLVRSPFEITKAVLLDGHTVTVTETVANVGAERIEVIWGSQLMLGGDLVAADTQVDAPASSVHPDPLHSDASYHDLMPWPRSYGGESVINLRTLPAPGAGESRLAYLTDFSRGAVTVTRPSRRLGLELGWDLATWPHLSYAVEAGGVRGFPWFGNAYFLALTPSTSWPAHGVHDARRVSDTTVWIDPGTALTARLTASVQPYPAPGPGDPMP